MKKEEFFELLEKKLAVIEESELQDILDEYEQHISMKMIDEHVTEEEAIEGFGDIDELTADILQAYHVRVQDNRKKKAEVSEKGKKFFSDAKKQVSHIFEKKEKEDIEGEKTKKPITSFGDKWSRFCRNFKNGIGAFCKGCYRIVSFCIKWIWKLICLFLLLLIGCSSCFLLFLLGTSFVLLLQKYPMWGILLVCLGMAFSSLAATIALVRYLRGEKKSPWIWLSKGTPAIFLTVVFFGGTFLSGIGAGVGFLEFSKFTYGGEVSLQQNGEEQTERACVRVPMEGVKAIEVQNVWGENKNLVKEFTWDESIPVGEICYEVDYISANTRFQADFSSYSEELSSDYIMEGTTEFEGKKDMENYINVHFYRYVPSDLKTILLLKDALLTDLKNRELHEYRNEPVINNARILVNPAMKDLVQLVGY